MQKAEELGLEQLKIKYDTTKAFEKSKYVSGIFPGNSEIRILLEDAVSFHDDRHIYISCERECNSELFLKEILRDKIYSDCYDYCYLYNFDQPDYPKIIQLPQGDGCTFKNLLEGSVKEAVLTVVGYFSEKEIKEMENAIVDEALARCENELENLKEQAKSMGFVTHMSDKGVFFVPVIEGKKISETDYDHLSLEEQENILNDLNTVEKSSKTTVAQIKQIKKELKNTIRSLKKRIVDELIIKSFEKLRARFQQEEKIVAYASRIMQSLQESLLSIVMSLSKSDLEKLSKSKNVDQLDPDNKVKYLVNVMSTTTARSCPIVSGQKVNYYELFGKIEYINDAGNYSTDFSMIQPGLIHQANGGYLILDVIDLIGSKLMWDKLKKSLTEKIISFDNIRELLGAIPFKTIIPEKIPLDIKVILVGDEEIYNWLYQLDPEFKEIFSQHFHVNSLVEADEERLAEFIKYFKKDEISDRALQRLLEFGIKSTGNKKTISTKISDYDRLVIAAKKQSQQDGSSKILVKHIKRAEEEVRKTHLRYQKNFEKLIKEESLILDTEGEKIGQINALSVCSYIDYQQAYPIKLTVNTFNGENGIISIEKENKLAGRIFGKSISIVESFLYRTFAKTKPFPFSSLICMEQVYGGIDGDSATLAIVYAILSSITETPINQGIAITGSMDQHGNVQPIGSVSTKIEGFYNACKIKGFTGKQGVIVPIQNADEIILPDDIKESVLRHQFHIYAIKNVQEGAIILMNTNFMYLHKMIETSCKKNK